MRKNRDDLDKHLKAYERTTPGFIKEVEEGYKQLKLALKIAQARKRKKLSQRELARRSGIPQPSIARIESSEYPNITVNTLERIAKALGGQLRVDISV